MHRPDRLVIHRSATSSSYPRRNAASRKHPWLSGPSRPEQQQQRESLQQKQNKELGDLQYATPSNVTPSTALLSLCQFKDDETTAASSGHNDNTTPGTLQTSSSLLSQGQQPVGVVKGYALSMLEGPLPAEVREIIYSQCSGERAEVAERHARRLLSTNRRVRVYREELRSAVEEVGDVAQLMQRHQTVQDALRAELFELDAQIARLVRERQLCELQLSQEEEARQRKEVKLRDANERVNALRSTIDAIAKESLSGYVLLRQLVPNLNVENYVN
ncbi:hypothetical protein TraAM80_03148 [Trypanosoma rangeli]|uniref:Uncharacterized protein n=1 Tax=Trypanosoma rangeli TaxID=5698 RepID=A0A3R7NU94_TRYRA|nr:uncharacterized protein TraAM80_03148 [Trypanosoma rangeli]RNF07774.1 hypothetical protein TraAM80_03148 [Trypanosoma rangeli]|eukprot:RNF07774.1 hypothetical protein TraAM80_03148 [Trypanosoma rangeli]